MTITPLRVTGAAGDPLTEAIELTRRLKLPHLRRAMADLIPTAKAQRWDPAEVVQVLLAEEAAGRDQANLRTRRKRAAFPAGKTFGDGTRPHPRSHGRLRTRCAAWNGCNARRTCPSAARRAPASVTSAKPSAKRPSRPA
ncbi:ATP-binding protein [Micromonospora sp. NBC_01412]|uniref:ATP-binding protein n=1 Tax=Micromonospora sp. NBC_01412 TaxID=2903590 RepID=UPI003866D9E4